MKIDDLISRLIELRDDLREELGDDVEPEIIGAYQPNYPLSGEILGACTLQEDEAGEPILLAGRPIVWLAIGSHPHNVSPYAPSAAFEQAE